MLLWLQTPCWLASATANVGVPAEFTVGPETDFLRCSLWTYCINDNNTVTVAVAVGVDQTMTMQ